MAHRPEECGAAAIVAGSGALATSPRGTSPVRWKVRTPAVAMDTMYVSLHRAINNEILHTHSH